MAINERLVHTASAAAAGNAGEEGLILHLDANDVDSYDGDGDIWYDIHDHEYAPATNVSEHFNTVLYTGDGSNKSITDVGFQPDLVWVKSRGAAHNVLFDSVRGAGKRLISNLNTSEDTGDNYGVISSFDSTGFTTDVQTNISTGNIGRSGVDYAAWCLKAGGLLNKSAEFNGSSSRIDLPGALLNSLTSVTYSVWVYYKGAGSGMSYGHIISGGSSNGTAGKGLGIAVRNSDDALYIWQAGGSVFSTTPLPRNQWSHIALTNNAGAAKIYLNGTEVFTTTLSSLNTDSSGNALDIGHYWYNGNHHFYGSISQFRIFNNALSSSQITQLYNETPSQNNAHLLGCIAAYPLGENANEIDGTNNGTATNVTFGLPGYANRNNDGTVESTVSVNNDLGFSIVKTTGTGGQINFGHGLDTVPEMIINKGTNASGWSWLVYHKDVGTGKYLKLDSSDATTTNSGSFSSITSTTITNNSSSSTQDYINYCFASKRGVSKVGSYKGTGASGNKVYTGFEPAFLLQKETNTSGVNWHIWDNARDSNPIENILSPNTNSAEGPVSSGITFNRDGFTINTTNGSINGNGDNYIYYAVAKYTNETELADTIGFKPSIDPDDHFNTVIYTGNAYTRSITGVGFQPDLIWIQNRTSTSGYYSGIFDSIRGTAKLLSSQNATIDSTAYTQQLTSFNSDGFSLGDNSDGGNYVNLNGNGYVAWCFNAGGNEVTNTDGTIDTTVRANNNLGFSIATYTGVGYPASSTAEIGHGLDSAPELVIIKGTGGTGQSGGAGSWSVGSSLLGNGWDGGIYLNSTAAYYNAVNYFWNGAPTSSVIKLKSDWFVNGANNNYVAYSFVSKRGVSKVGTYEGTGTSGNKIFTEFEPAFLMIKNADDTGNWLILDNVRDTDGVLNEHIYANLNSAEATASTATVTPNRDGFTIGNSNSIHLNRSGDTFIYLAFAKNTNNEQPHLELNLEADSYSGSGDWLDSSGNGNNGTITGATHDDELGDFFDLSGSGDYIDIPTSGVFTGDFTVEMWYNFNTLNPPSGSTYRMLLGTSGYQSGSGLGHYIEYGRLRTWVSVNGSTTNVLNGSGTDLTTNKWQHVVLTRSGGTYTQYIDTNQVGQATNTTASLDGANSRIGAHYNSTSHNIDAKVGQVRLYSVALSQAQITQNYNLTKPKYPNEFHGDINGATWNASGYFEFDGSNDSIDLSTSIGSTFWANNWSASAWVYFDSTSAANQCIFTSHGLAYNYLYTNNNTQLRYSNDNGVTINTSSGTISASQWHHIVVTRSGVDGTVIYVDKVSVGTDSSSNNAGASSASGAKPQIGAYTSTSSYPDQYPLDGKVSKFKLYSKALTQSEVDALHGEGY